MVTTKPGLSRRDLVFLIVGAMAARTGEKLINGVGEILKMGGKLAWRGLGQPAESGGKLSDQEVQKLFFGGELPWDVIAPTDRMGITPQEPIGPKRTYASAKYAILAIDRLFPGPVEVFEDPLEAHKNHSWVCIGSNTSNSETQAILGAPENPKFQVPSPFGNPIGIPYSIMEFPEAGDYGKACVIR